ncbi:hypothetical protein H4219_002457 [Mycoemilia scoparia]|uniref:M7GpppX diphosphatase n=1 Tax=Mycoemilia scoparia TaxID=417184 RepID=A0A9W7ZXJ7_9FUNG|nr:hypothetical protein H4219_002457 [Mycoemilia scoparia]
MSTFTDTEHLDNVKDLIHRFEIREVLNEDPRSKMIYFLGVIHDDYDKNDEVETNSIQVIPGKNAAIITLERLAFSRKLFLSNETNNTENASDKYPLKDTRLVSCEKNDIYAWAQGFLANEDPNAANLFPNTRFSIIYPAKEKNPMLIMYFSVHNHSKWDGKTIDSLYMVVLVHRRDLKSLRDLTAQHLPLLNNIQDKVIGAVKDKFPGFHSDQLRFYIHYQPSYYHLHIHVTNVQLETPSMFAGRAHMLDTVIDNITTFGSDYYQKATIPFVLGENDVLFSKLASK